MGFDLDSPPIDRGDSGLGKMLTTKQHLEQLQRKNLNFMEMCKSTPSSPRTARQLQHANGDMAKVDGTVRAAAQISPPSPSSWHGDMNLHFRPPASVTLRVVASGRSASKRTIFVVGDGTADSVLRPETTVGTLRELVRQQLLPSPHTAIIIEHWGNPLDEGRTLAQCGVREESSLDVRLVDQRPAGRPTETLSRLRVTSSALGTRELTFPEGCQGAELRRLVAESFTAGELRWLDESGRLVSMSKGATAVALASCEAVEGGTDALTAGEELVLEASQASLLRSGKGTAKARRRETGRAACVSDAQVGFVVLRPEAAWPDEEGAFRLSVGGVTIGEGASVAGLARGIKWVDVGGVRPEAPAVELFNGELAEALREGRTEFTEAELHAFGTPFDTVAQAALLQDGFIAARPEAYFRPAAFGETSGGLRLRQDDAVILEFASPLIPDPLKLVRSPGAPAKEKKGKKGK